MIQKVLLLALAGAAGTLARVGVVVVSQRLLGPRFPWGTVVVNLAGCLAFGLLWTLAEERGRIGPELRTIALVGFMGAFTTFSSFVNDSVGLAQSGRPGAALLNVALQNTLGIGCFLLGAYVGREIA
jgi:fluoride exporter